MADERIIHPDVAAAGVTSRSYVGIEEPVFDLSAQIIDQDFPYVLAADTDLPVFSVVSYNPTTKAIALAQYSAGASNANLVLKQPLKGLSGATGRFAAATQGHWNSRGLTWHASFDTRDKREGAFRDSKYPLNLVSTTRFSSDVIENAN